MAKVSDAPLKHHDRARSIPAEILETLCPGELRLRIARSSELEHSAEGLPPRDGASFLTRARKVLDSEPVWDYVQRQRELMTVIEEMGRIPGRDIWALRQEHADSNEYYPGLPEAIESVYDKSPSNPILADVAAHILAHHHRSTF